VASTRTSRVNRALIGSVILAGALLVAPLTAQATPQRQSPAPPTSSQVVAQLADLAKSNNKLTEQFNQAQIDVTQAEEAAAAATRDAARAELALRTAQRALATSLASQYKGASFSHTAALLASTSGQSYLETMQSLNILSVHQSEVAKNASSATTAAKAAEATAKNLVDAAIAKRLAVSSQRDALQVTIAKQKRLLAALTAAERAQFLSANAPTPAQVVKITAAPVLAKSKGAATAVQAALSQRGKPYVWGAAGPDSYDCSGLTMWAWGQAGVSLPHQSADQQNMGVAVAQGQLQPGDLVFFGSPAYHVGIYIGDGMMVHAPTTGDVVKISALANMSDYSGARRVG
jgi:cell wall-associated NlpC family hydrolase